MLLTSSQVSVAVSCGIVVLCTSALFLSGYVIQQRTLRELRSSIRSPKPEPPKIFLPDRFKKMTTELADGTVVEIEDEDEITIAGVGPESGKQQTIVVTPSRPGAEDQRHPISQQQQQRKQQPQQNSAPRKDQPQAAERNPGRNKAAPRPSPGTGDKAELAASAGKLSDKPQKPISRAERRRKIKEELKRLAYDDKPVYYQRRLY